MSDPSQYIDKTKYQVLHVWHPYNILEHIKQLSKIINWN
jgi:hypothetical protein